MKKVFVVATMALFVFASCKKDYTCECTTTNGSETSTTSQTLNGKKDDVKTACEGGNITAGSSSIKCEIKD